MNAEALASMDKAASEIDEKIDYHLKQKAALQQQLLTLHRRIRYREDAIRTLALKKTEVLQFNLPGTECLTPHIQNG